MIASKSHGSEDHSDEEQVVESIFEEEDTTEAPRRQGKSIKSGQVVELFPIRSGALWSILSIFVSPALVGSVITNRQALRRARDFLPSFAS